MAPSKKEGYKQLATWQMLSLQLQHPTCGPTPENGCSCCDWHERASVAKKEKKQTIRK